MEAASEDKDKQLGGKDAIIKVYSLFYNQCENTKILWLITDLYPYNGNGLIRIDSGVTSRPNHRLTGSSDWFLSGWLSLFGTIETGRNRIEPPVNRRLGFEVILKIM